MNEPVESPSIAYTSLKTPSGFIWSFTVRTPISEKDNNALVAEIQRMEEVFKVASWTPHESIRGAFTKKEVSYVPDKPCPIDNGKLKVVVSKKNGKTYWTCENNHYDYQTKTQSGCKFICEPSTYDQKVKEIKKAKEEDYDFDI